MIQSIIPIAKVAAPYVIKGLVSTAKTLGIASSVAYAFTRGAAEVVEEIPTRKGNWKDQTKFEASFLASSVFNTVKACGPSAAIFAAAEVVTPINPPIAVGLYAVAAGVAFAPLAKNVWDRRSSKVNVEDEQAELDEMWDNADVPVFHHNESQRAQDDGVRYEPVYVGEVDADLMEIEFSDLDLARVKRTPGRVGHEFGARFKDDEEKVTIVRHTLKKTLQEEKISGSKIQQLLIGFDREVSKTA